MAVTSGFFNAVLDSQQKPDRTYDAEDLGRLFDGVITDGVFANFGDMFSVTRHAGTTNSVTVGTGKAWFHGTWIENNSAHNVTLTAPDETRYRYDAIVLDIDKSMSRRENRIIGVSGTPSVSNPVLPTLVNDDANQHWQYLIAAVKRSPNGSYVQASEITNYVGRSGGAPISVGGMEPIDISALINDSRQTFEEWKDSFISALTEDEKVNLQAEIDVLKLFLKGSTTATFATKGLYDLIVPVGTVQANYSSSYDPNTLYPGTTWVQFAQGRTLVGVDSSDTSLNSAGKTGGEKTHLLTANESGLPRHRHHWTGYYSVNNNASLVKVLSAASQSDATNRYTDYTGGTDAEQEHNNMQPYVTVYYWRRTA